MENFDVFRLDGHTLRVFLTVCDTKSVSQTADRFDLNQSTISHTIDKMRTAVADPLFVKAGRGILPTDRALSLVPIVKEILAKIEGLVEDTSYDIANDNRPIVVGIPTPALLPQIKSMHRALQQVAPQISFQVARLAPREKLAEMLTQAEVDVAIAVNLQKLPADLNATRYGDDDLVVYYDPDRRGPIDSVEAYAEATHAVAGFGGRTKSVVEEALDRHGMSRRVGFVAPTASFLGDFLLGTDLIATMPRGLSRHSYSKLAYSEPPLTLPPLRYDLVWHRRYEHSGRNIWIRRALLR